MALVFHKLVSVEEAIDAISGMLGGLKPLGIESASILDSAGKVLSKDVYAKVDSPPFDRSIVDGYAVSARDVYGASEGEPVVLKVVGKADIGQIPQTVVEEETCVEIATGAPIPQGANAVVMVEYTKRTADKVLVYRSLVPGENVAQTGSDITAGDIIIRSGKVVTSREQAVLAALGYREVEVHRQPRVAVFSTGNELTEPGKQLMQGRVYDVNGYTITTMLRELGASSDFKGVLADEFSTMKETINTAIRGYDAVITSGSTSAGFGDMIYKIFNEIGGPGVIIHGLKVKPGKPTVVAVAQGKLLIGLPGFPLSAMMVFSVLVKPVILRMAGIPVDKQTAVARARMAFRIEAGKGKRELIPAQLVRAEDRLVAYPVLSGSGATSALSISDGFIDVPEQREFLEQDEEVQVNLFSPNIRLPDLVIIGSHCPGIDVLVDLMDYRETRIINVGSMGGWYSVKRGEADICGTHLLDERTMNYNVHMVEKMGLAGEVSLVRGYARSIGFIVKKGNPDNINGFDDLLRKDVLFINRNKGSGIRTLIDIKLRNVLGGKLPEEYIRNYDNEAKTHTAVAAAVLHGRADVGVAIEAVARMYDLEFVSLGEEIFDFLLRKDRLRKETVRRFLETLASEEYSRELSRRLAGYRTLPETGQVVAGSQQ